MAWTADELAYRDGGFLDGLDERGEAFVVKVPLQARVWLKQSQVLKIQAPNGAQSVRRCQRDRYPRCGPAFVEQRLTLIRRVCPYRPHTCGFFPPSGFSPLARCAIRRLVNQDYMALSMAFTNEFHFAITSR